ncbi:sensor histidine kinase [Sulfuricystis multivorans]|uniref:sensor histidine kinase n=1 Tax=Sulfuricystis multivorans TaxID=2211108 RepID=UPI000F84098E|nr:ATP-binding protein [Sulfuricystis multivorans]
MLSGSTPVPDIDARWRLLNYFSWYRLIVAGFFFGVILLSSRPLNIGSQDPRFFLWTSGTYLGLSIVALVVETHWRKAFDSQLSAQVIADIVCLTLMLYASGGAKSGMAMMLIVVLVGAALVGQGRLVLFYAALASLLLLAEQAWRVAFLTGDSSDFYYTGLTCIGLFGSAIAARLLANRMIANEELARRRGIELADQLHINERVIRDMQDGVLVIDAQGGVRQCNPRARALLGCTMAHPRMLADFSPLLAEEFRVRSARGIESELVMQVPWTGRDLRVRFLPPGEGGNALIFVEDVGRLQQEARQVKLAALGRLTANLAHEIRNPLSAISHAAELLADEPSGKGIERLTRIILDNVQRLNRLVSEVVELGRRDRVHPETIELGDFFRHLLDERALHDAGNLERISVEIPPGRWVHFDRGHLHRVVANLLDNALRYASQAPGAVRVWYEENPAQDRPSLHFVDDGKGIIDTERDRVFEPFFTTRANGTGLGLYIARELCEANGARLFLLENAPGAHFCLSFAPWRKPAEGEGKQA